MSGKRTGTLSNHKNDGATAAVGRTHSHRIPFRSVQAMIFLNWIEPPIGFNMTNVDKANPSYRVRIMNVGVPGGGTSLILPFTEAVAWNPSAPPLTLWQFQMVGVPNTSDPTTLQYYQTMTVVQVPPGLQTIRSRIFITPQAAPFPSIQSVPSGSLTVLPSFQVQNVVDVSNYPLTVSYAHVKISDNTDPNGPHDLFLQQPWTS
jgi:hypothetical protein